MPDPPSTPPLRFLEPYEARSVSADWADLTPARRHLLVRVALARLYRAHPGVHTHFAGPPAQTQAKCVDLLTQAAGFQHSVPGEQDLFARLVQTGQTQPGWLQSCVDGGAFLTAFQDALSEVLPGLTDDARLAWGALLRLLGASVAYGAHPERFHWTETCALASLSREPQRLLLSTERGHAEVTMHGQDVLNAHASGVSGQPALDALLAARGVRLTGRQQDAQSSERLGLAADLIGPYLRALAADRQVIYDWDDPLPEETPQPVTVKPMLGRAQPAREQPVIRQPKPEHQPAPAAPDPQAPTSPLQRLGSLFRRKP